MQCPVCASETLSVQQSPKRGLKTDIRIVECRECGTLYYTETRISDIIIDGEAIRIDRLTAKTVEAMQDSYMGRKTRALKNQLEFF
jgi:hypothetical protein